MEEIIYNDFKLIRKHIDCPWLTLNKKGHKIQSVYIDQTALELAYSGMDIKELVNTFEYKYDYINLIKNSKHGLFSENFSSTLTGTKGSYYYENMNFILSKLVETKGFDFFLEGFYRKNSYLVKYNIETIFDHIFPDDILGLIIEYFEFKL